MARGPKIAVTITGDETDLKKAFKSSGDAVNSFGGTFKRTVGATFTGAILGAIDTAVNAVFDFAQTGIAQFDKLGDATDRLEQNTKGLGKAIRDLDLTAFGFDDVEAAEAARTISNVGEAIGLTNAQAKEYVPQLTAMAALYAATNDLAPDRAADLMGKALAGSTKAAKALGVEIDKNMTPQERYNALFEKFGPAAQEAAKQSGSTADAQEELGAIISDVSTTFGEFLNGILKPVVRFVIDKVVPAFKGLTKSGSPLQVMFEHITDFIRDEVIPIIKRLAPIVGTLLQKVFDAANKVVKALAPLFDLVVAAAKLVWAYFKNVLMPFLEKVLLPILDHLFDLIGDVAGAMSGPLKTAVNGIKRAFGFLKNVLDDVLDFLRDIINRIKGVPFLGDAISAVTGGHAVMAAPALYTGGPTAGTLGSPGGIGSRAATSASGGGNVIVNINGGDPIAIEATVLRALRGYARKNGSSQVLPTW
jgi:hypothetical protein